MKTSNFIKGKKGQAHVIGPSGSLVTATIVIAAMLIIFFLFSRAMHPFPAKDISGQELKAQSTASLSNYLNTKTLVNGQEIRISDLIKMAKADSGYKPALEAATREIFDKAYGSGYQFWIISEGKTMVEMNTMATAKYGWVQTKFELPEKIEVYLQVAGGKNE